MLASALSALLRHGRVRATRSFSSIQTARARGAPIDIHPEVEQALASHQPVVALETTVVTHGFPHPDNFQLALELETIVRNTGCVPATIGLIGGRVKIGLEKHELERLADTRGSRKHSTVKVSRRDIAPTIATGADGGTTCSATVILAALAGIKVFATGGLGGVHRGGENSFDISTDLHELARRPVGLVSSGIKSILDIGRTLEYLETLGVPAISFSKTRDFPAFFSRQSGYQVPWNTDDPLTVAKILHAQWQLGLENGALIAVPIPEEYEAAGLEIQRAVNQAVAESEANGVSKRGKEATPWLLTRIGELTNGASLESNVALLKNTALVGGQIAVKYQELQDGQNATAASTLPTPIQLASGPQDLGNESVPLPNPNLVIVGAAAIDITARADSNFDDSLISHSTVPGQVATSLGGVGRNISEAAHRVSRGRSDHASTTVLVSPVGADAFGRFLIGETRSLGMRTDGLVQVETPTAVCNMVLNGSGDLVGGVADMGTTSAFTGDMIVEQLETYSPKLVAVDGNLSPTAITHVLNHCAQHKIPLFFEPTSVTKSTAIFPAIASRLESAPSITPVAFASPNLLELRHMYEVARSEPFNLLSHPAWWPSIASLSLGDEYRRELELLSRKPVRDVDTSDGSRLSFLVEGGVAQMAVNLLPFFQHLIIKCGDKGVIVAFRLQAEETETKAWLSSNLNQRYIVARGTTKEILVVGHFPPLRLDAQDGANVTGAGDSFVGALLAALVQTPTAFQSPESLQRIISIAQQAAVLTLQSPLAVSASLSDINIV